MSGAKIDAVSFLFRVTLFLFRLKFLFVWRTKQSRFRCIADFFTRHPTSLTNEAYWYWPCPRIVCSIAVVHSSYLISKFCWSFFSFFYSMLPLRHRSSHNTRLLWAKHRLYSYQTSAITRYVSLVFCMFHDVLIVCVVVEWSIEYN